MHAIDVAVLQKSGVVLPVEVKFGRTIYSGERFVTRLVGAMSIGSDLRLKGSVPTILAAHSQDLLPHLAKVELAGSTFPLEKEWGIAIIRDQFTKVQDLISKNQDSRVNEAEVTWPSGLRYILVYEEIRDALGARFEDIVFSLWPPHGSASGTLL